MAQESSKIYHELLILKAQAGDRGAFETMVKLWEKPFFSYARTYTQCETTAWDIVQETWVVIIRKLNSLSHPAKFKSWAFRILTNKCIDCFRRASIEKKLKKSVVENEKHQNTKSFENQPLENAIQQLRSEQKALILLRFNQSMSILEISKVLNVPEGTVKSRLHRTLNELKQSLQGDYYE